MAGTAAWPTAGEVAALGHSLDQIHARDMRRAFEQCRLAADCEVALYELKARGGLQIHTTLSRDSHLSEAMTAGVLASRDAIDHWMEACGGFMRCLPAYSGDFRCQVLINQHISFIMGRIDAINKLVAQSSQKPEIKPAELPPPPSPEVAAAALKGSEQMEKRRRVANEIRDTEKSYLRALGQLVGAYLKPLTTAPGSSVYPDDPDRAPLTVEEAKAIFSNIEEIVGLSQTFLAQLDRKVDAWDERSTMGDVFRQFAQFFKVYMLFTNNYEAGLKRMDELVKANSRVAAIMSSPKDPANPGAAVPNLQSLMIQPVQRLPRYVLLLKELIKRTPEGHPDAALLPRALTDIKEVADHVNERLRGHENNAKVLEIQNSLWAAGEVPTLLAPGRRFVMEGDLLKLRRNGRLKEFHCFLFNDCFLYGTERLLKGRYHYHNTMQYHGVFKADEDLSKAGYETEGFGFRVTGPTGFRIFVAKSQIERAKWMEAITAHVDERTASSNHRKSLIMKRMSAGKT